MIKIQKFGLKSKKVCQMSRTLKRMNTFIKSIVIENNRPDIWGVNKKVSGKTCENEHAYSK